MRKLFISQPMRGKTDEEIRAEREKAISLAKSYTGDEVEVIGSFFNDFNGTPLEFLAKSIALLATADIVYFAEGWERARGCRIEHECAVAYEIDRIELDSMLLTTGSIPTSGRVVRNDAHYFTAF